MRPFWLLATLFVALMPVAGRAQTAPVVVELFTSQGCSSCPPADALLTQLAAQPGVIALALHVDYWDYLGWQDSFASPAFSARQKAYAKARGSRSIFTPQMMVQGFDSMVGHDEMRIRDRIAAHQAIPPAARLDLRRDGAALVIRITPGTTPVEPAEVHVVRFTPSHDVAIEGGENAGQIITYSNIVESWETVAIWDGATAAELRHEGLDDAPVAVILQHGRVGPVLTAASLP